MNDLDVKNHFALIGKKYNHRLKNRTDVYTVIDCLLTYNSNGELVKVRYVAEHEFLGQKVRDTDVVATTILRNEIKERVE